MNREEKSCNANPAGQKPDAKKSEPPVTGYQAVPFDSAPLPRIDSDFAEQGSATKLGFDPSDEVKLAVFTNFWYAAVRYQILKKLSDKGLADLLFVSPHTVANWRNCIAAAGAVITLVDFGEKILSEHPKPNLNVRKVVQALREHLRRLEAEVAQYEALGSDAPPRRQVSAGLPSLHTFAAAVESSIDTVLANLLMKLDDDRSRVAGIGSAAVETKMAAKKLGNQLVAAYSPAEDESEKLREDLARQLEEVARISSRLSFHAALNMVPVFKEEDVLLESQLKSEVQAAMVLVNSYVSEIYLSIVRQDQASERSAFLSRLWEPRTPRQAQDFNELLNDDHIEQAKASDLKNLRELVHSVARIRAPVSRRVVLAPMPK